MKIAIIDYGSGNLHSTLKAFERMAQLVEPHATVKLVTNTETLITASHIVLPGVGAFGDCMNGLTSMDGMVDALNVEVLQKGKPFLGICVGMQLLAQRGLEYGNHVGLGWIKGEVVSLTPSDSTLKIPHMGWNNLTFPNPHPLFANITAGSDVYFVHSYHMHCHDSASIIAETDYGQHVTAAVARDNVMGVQFHPEKSQQVGLQIIENFLRM